MSWLFSQELVGAYLGDISSVGEQSVQSNGKPTQLAYLSQDKMTKYSRLSRFGMMYKPLTENLGEELLMLYLEDFHAKTSQLQEMETDLTEKGQECGERWQGLLARLDQDSFLWKIPQCSLLEDSEQSLETWPRWGTMQNGVCWEQPMLVQTIKETGFGLLQKIPNNQDFFHTPNTTELDGGSNSRKALKKRMADTPSGNWPTPTCADIYTDKLKSTQQSENSMHSVSLSQAVQKWPTPTAGLSKHGATPEYWENRIAKGRQSDTHMEVLKKMWGTPKAQDSRHASWDRGKSNLGEQVAGLHNGGHLNPTWTEWLMGWPLEWTDLKPLEMDKSHFVQQQHGQS